MPVWDIVITVFWLLFIVNLIAPKAISQASNWLIKRIKHFKTL
jgi:hypothetical protein